MNNQIISDTTIRVIYLIPKGKKVNEVCKSALEKGITNVQEWFKSQLGISFKLHSPIIETHQSNNDSDWFLYYPGNNPHNYKAPKFNSYYNAKIECAKLGVKDNDDKFTWVCYLDGGTQGCGLNSFTFLPIEDLLNLTIEIESGKYSRWTGGLAHELGHGLGLDDLKHYSNEYNEKEFLMGTGYHQYPKTKLTPKDKNILVPRLQYDYNNIPPPNEYK